MQFLNSLLLCVNVLLMPLMAAAASRTITVYAWPLTDDKPSELAQITYDSTTLNTEVLKYTPLNAPYEVQDRVRVGFYESGLLGIEHEPWHGVVTSAATFDPTLQQKLWLHIDSEGQAYHVGFGAVQKISATENPSKAGGSNGQRAKQQDPVSRDKPLMVELVRPGASPEPVLNKPIKLNPQGKLPDKAEEKSFLQKYWWAIGAFLLIQLVMGGGKE